MIGSPPPLGRQVTELELRTIRLQSLSADILACFKYWLDNKILIVESNDARMTLSHSLDDWTKKLAELTGEAQK